MKIKFSLAYLSVLALCVGACTSSKQTAVRSVESQRAAGQAAPTSINEPTLVGVTSKFINIDSTQVRVFVYVDAVANQTPISVEDFIRLYNLNYVMYSDYGTRDRLAYGNVPLTPQNLTRLGDQVVAQFDVKKPGKDYGVLLMEISQTGTLKKVLNDLAIRFREQRDSDRFAVYESGKQVPLRRHFVTQNEPVQIRSISDRSEPLQVFYYRHGFDAAASPMNTVPRTVSKSLQVDSTFTIQSNESVAFAQEGLYYIQSDTTQAEGLGLLVTNDRYPKMTRPEQLKEPLLYMSTNQEITEMQNARDSKKALDKYWLSLMGGNPELARQVIRNYYSRVEEANRLFTSYKEGWKTDKGMIFIILGPPDKVQRSKDKEVWVYDQKANATNVNFTFNKRSNQFVDDHYELVRYVEYQPIWYPVVEAWRNGAIR
ncbi:GWxTD domain-containing protein [Salmonirosea aquatica]|uniref:GWxTD domain-containing protein n=1 Tax=Salmonirosea aquatica TaxID=2654236 RepID=A0A7C9BLC1_9BACT|nr:GWxTD domain-containing protein [Cytophagaceae bacterium SJW1-29]